jgi:hypothetical protein
VSGVQHIAIVGLDVDDFEIGDTIDHNVACIVFLSTRFRIEACLVQDKAKRGILWNVLGGLEEGLVVKDRFDR